MRLSDLKRNKLLVVVGMVWMIGIITLYMHLAGYRTPASSSSYNQQEPQAPPPALVVPAPLQTVTTHEVQEGETLSGIAEQYHLDVETLLNANTGISEDLHPGDELIILPQKGILHLVDRGDTLWSIATMYGVGIDIIMAANGKKTDNLALGEKIFVPGGHLQRSQQVSRGKARFAYPVWGEMTSPFGYRWGRLHAGIDIANEIGTVIRAAGGGRVVFTGWQGGYGYTVMIDHGLGYVTLYGHLLEYLVSPGQQVQGGQIIAYMGSTGDSTGPHLHFEVRKDDEPINPLTILP